MRLNTIAILVVVCGLTLSAMAQDQPAGSQYPQTPAQTQSMPAQQTPASQTTAPVPEQNVAPALPASDQMNQNLPADQSAISQQLIQSERDSWENAKAKNVSYFSQLPANVTAAFSDGSTENKGDIESRVRKYGIGDFNLNNFSVTFPSSDRAEVTYTASFTGRGGANENRQVTSQWQRDASGIWQNVRVDFR